MRGRINQKEQGSEERWSTSNWLIAFNVLLVVLRVFLIISLWLLLFLAVFLGYLTLPLFFLLIVAFLYATIRLSRWSRRLAGQIHHRAGTR